VFAGSISAAVVLAEARGELERLGIVAEEERIARDLHDTVIQQVFALGMSLQAIRASVGDEAAARIDGVVDALDDVIRQIRNTIFRLPARGRGSVGFRDAVLRLVELHRERLGFAPRVAFEGPVDTVVSEGLAEHVLNVVAEGLANIARHAGASFAEVVVVAREDSLVVVVLDDGRGVGEGPSAGSGLRNLRSRAEELGGESSLHSREPRGTILEWRVPL
jgi:signal transduction histidine kinase